MAEERKFTSLQDLLKQKERISLESAGHGHEAFFPVAVRVQGEDGKVSIRGKATPTPPADVAKRGRILMFIPTKERVTLLRERLGKSYQGDWIHEVTTRDGHKFLAMQKQLKEVVK